jgi:hypothetical protein
MITSYRMILGSFKIFPFYIFYIVWFLLWICTILIPKQTMSKKTNKPTASKRPAFDLEEVIIQYRTGR